eukprot:10508234-Lingulodinium_polyedra.AAC.1
MLGACFVHTRLLRVNTEPCEPYAPGHPPILVGYKTGRGHRKSVRNRKQWVCGVKNAFDAR